MKRFRNLMIIALVFVATTVYANSILQLGVTQITLNDTDYHEYFFTPSNTGIYVFYSTGEFDTRIIIKDSETSEILASDDDGGESYNFHTECLMVAGETYSVNIKSYDVNATFDTIIEYEEVITVEISTADELIEFATSVNSGSSLGCVANLMNDIDLTGVTWIPIGNEVNGFKGVFNGNGYTIENLNIDSEDDYVGFFGYTVNNFQIKDLNLTNVNVKGGFNVGGLIGRSGYRDESLGGKITNCHVSGTVTGIDYVGGVAGQCRTPTEYCSFTGNVSGEDSVGGMFGVIDDATFEQCYSVGTVTGNVDVGGLVGHINDTGAYIYNSFSMMQVLGGTDNISTFIGYCVDDSSEIRFCYSAENAENATGGFVGNNSGIVTDCFYNNSYFESSESQHGVGKSNEELRELSTFSGWDFENIWSIDTYINNGYPYLKKMNISEVIVNFNANGGTCNTNSKVVFTEFTYGTLPTPQKSGCVFVGWFTENDEKITENTLVTTNNEHILYAKWRETGGKCGTDSFWRISNNKLIIWGSGNVDRFYDLNEEEFYIEEQSIISVEIEEGITNIADNVFSGCEMLNEVKLPSTLNQIGKRAFYRCGITDVYYNGSFTKWNEIAIDSTNTEILNSLIHYFVNIYFNSNSGECNIDNKTVTNGLLYGALPTPIREHYTFLGWFSENGDLVTENTIVNLSENQTLYANWQGNIYTLSFDNNINTLPILTRSIEYGTTYGKLPKPKRNGYYFKGWINDNGEKITSDNIFNSEYGDMTLYAEWEKKETIIQSGKCGDNCYWRLNSDGVLTIYGNGVMSDFKDEDDNDIYMADLTINEIVIEDGIGSICDNAFDACENITKVLIPNTVTQIGRRAFYGCDNITNVYYAGTEDEWNDVIISTRNDSLLNARLYYNYILIDTVYIVNEDETISLDVGLNGNITDTAEIIVAKYDDNKFVGCELKEVHSTNQFLVSEDIESYKIFIWDGFNSLKPLSDSITEYISKSVYIDEVIESSHPYLDNINQTKAYTYEGECESIEITFSENTQTENRYDYIYILDANNNQIGKYCGTELAGKTITIPGNTVKIKLKTDGSITNYGYSTKSIVVNK